MSEADTRASLEEQRDFLLRSLEDLETEHDAGDLDDDDYRALKDDYTARAAAVIRRLERQGRTSSDTRSPVRSPTRRSTRTRSLLMGATVVAVALLAGFLVKEAAGRRDPGDGITGGVRGSSRELVAEGDRLLGQDPPDADGAIAAYLEALDIDPENVDALLHLATAQVAAGDAGSAIATYDDVLALEPENLEALAYQASLFHREGDTERALTQLDRAIELDKTFVDSWGLRVAILADRGRLDEALDEMEALAAGGDSDIALAVTQQVSALLSPVDGLKVYDAVIEGDPDNAVALAYRGWQPALIARQDGVSLDDQEALLTEALDFLDRAVAADPDLPDAHAFRAIVLHQLDRDEEAAEELRAFDASDPPTEMQAIVDQSGLREELGVPAPE